jgi:hypothetical protein
MRGKAAFSALVVAGALVGISAPAGAAPVNAKTVGIVNVDCGSGTFQVATMGNGDWTPAHVIGTNQVFIPTAFGEFTGTFTPTGGTPTTETEPAISKPSPRNGKDVVHCSYTLHFESAEGTFVGHGTVTGFSPNG